jgi:hypothetical protein
VLWAVSLEPDSASPHANAALVLIDVGAKQEALHHASRAVALQPDSAHAHLALGLTHVAMKNRGAAKRELRVLQLLDRSLGSVLGAALIETW